VNQEKFFRALGRKIRELRQRHRYSQEDMIYFGFSSRHWQQIEAGRPITMTTLLRICEVFETPLERVVRGLDAGIYKRAQPVPLIARGRRKRTAGRDSKRDAAD
jgi:transcriptional regulator with XRE-family HTH domain